MVATPAGKRALSARQTVIMVEPVAANVRNQDFSCERPDQKWGADIRYIWTSAGGLYLAMVVDLYSRRSVG